MKLTYEEKCEIYHKWKYEGYGCNTLGHIYGTNCSKANYIVRLADKHGIEILKHRFTHYSIEFKQKAIDRVFDGESITEVSIDLGITSSGILPTWIKEYKQNGYSIVNINIKVTKNVGIKTTNYGNNIMVIF